MDVDIDLVISFPEKTIKLKLILVITIDIFSTGGCRQMKSNTFRPESIINTCTSGKQQ